MTKEQLRREWKGIVTRYEREGGKNQSEWCRENGIGIRTFNRWYNIFKKETSIIPTVQGWIPLQITEEHQTPSLNLKIGKVNIEVKKGFQPLLLAEVVKVLGEIC